ncbi:vacuolar protein-sorting machinery protein HSE1, Class E [Ceratobasidium sp. AG-Ba]|nr:vacuolar protein-sorting machinery protein HSE1, Class E [Ceratobasidium sp. AG-Ba]
MFRGGQVNPYDDIVVKATDENQTSENWEILINLCDKVSDDGEQGARNVIAALLKRLTHRNANVQLYALSVAEALSKNCDITVHREMASKAFTQGLEKLATDRNGHEKVKKRTLALIKLWAGEFAYDPQLGLMEECYSSLKAKGMRFEDFTDNPAPTFDDEAARREEEELQRVLEMSKTDKGGRDRWNEYTSYGMGGASGSGSSSQPAGGSSAGPAYTPAAGPAYTPAAQPAVASSSRQQPVPAQTPAPVVQPQAPTPAPAVEAPPQAATPAYTSAPAAAATPASPGTDATPLDPSTLHIVKRVRALHDFSATEVGELSFKKGDIIKVVDRCFKDWWRGQMKGRTGIFPVNYVEPLPEPTAAELAKEAETEALVWSQGGAIDTLLQKLREFDPATENLNDNEEIQELYRSSMSLRPKILKLIDKYSQKKAELVVMNERYVKARNTFERMMEESVARHNPSAAVYDYPQPPNGADQYSQPGNRATAYGWNANLYGQGAGVVQPGVQAPPDASAYAYQQSQQYQQPVTNVPQEYPPQPYAGYPQGQGQAQQGQAQAQGQDQQYISQYGYAGYQQPQPGQDQAQGQSPYPQPYPQQQQQHPQPPQQQPQQTGQQQYQSPQQAQPPQAQLQHSYSYASGVEAQHQAQPPAQAQVQPQQQAQPPEQVQQPQTQAYGQPQPHSPQAQQLPGYDAQAQQQHQPYVQPVEGQNQPGYQQPTQAQAQPQVQGQPPQQGHQPTEQTQPQPQPAEHQPQQQPQEATPAADQGPPYPWNGTNKYPNPGACQWAEYYLGGGDDLSGLVYFTGPDGQVLTSIPPRDGFGAQMHAVQQGFAQVGLT